MKQHIFVFLVLFVALSVQDQAVQSDEILVVPAPNSITTGTNVYTIQNPCHFRIQATVSLTATIIAPISNFIKQIAFPLVDCSSEGPHLLDLIVDTVFSPQEVLTVYIQQPDVETAGKFPQDESYKLILKEGGDWRLEAKTYAGFARGAATFLQVLRSKTLTNKNGHTSIFYYIPQLPIVIEDSGVAQYRGVMLDTSKHFLSLHTMKRTIDGLFLSKMNVVHWLFADKYHMSINMASLNSNTTQKQYSHDDVKVIVEYAKNRGILVIPEFTAPGRTHYFTHLGKPEVVSCHDTNVLCYEPVCGQINPLDPGTVGIVNSIVTEMQGLFPETPYFHFSGTDINTACWEWDKNTSNHPDGVSSLAGKFLDTERSFSDRIKIRKAIYWHDSPYNKNGDMIQYAGLMKDFDNYRKDMTTKGKNKMEYILSSYDYLRFDCGSGGFYGSNEQFCGGFVKWQKLLDLPLPSFAANSEIRGAEALVYGDMVDENNIDFILWPRTFVLAEILWRGQSPKSLKDSKYLERFKHMRKFMVNSGIASAPI